MKVKDIPAILTPLNVEHEWEGCFVFNRCEKGHCWKFGDRDIWKRVAFKAQKGNKKIKCKEKKPLTSLVKKYKELKNKLKTEYPSMLFSETDSGYIKWLLNPDDRCGEVNGGLSLVLNALVRQSTIKPFYLLFTMVEEHAMVEVRNLGQNIPSWFYYTPSPSQIFDESLVCYPELFCPVFEGEVDKTKENKNKFNKDDICSILNAHKSFRVKHSYEVRSINITNDELKIVLRDRVQTVEYIKGAICNCIPVPGKVPENSKTEPKGVNSPEVIISSPVVTNTLDRLSRIWQDPHVKSVLISSPPGSGKEVFASSIPFGNGRPIANLQFISVASEDQNSLEKQLYGFEKVDGSVSEGLISKAAGSAIFLDEIHQPEACKDKSSLRSSLLRTLEADAYYPILSVNQKKVNNVLFIMATSKTIEDLANYKPSDFWTRMTYSLQIPHPLDFELDGMEKVVADFFRLFWWNLCEKQYGIDPLEDPNNHGTHLISEYWQLYAMMSLLFPDNLPTQSGKPEIFASTFLEQLRIKGRAPHKYSIRGIRNLVSQLFSIAWSDTAQGKEPWDNSETFRTMVIKLFNESLKVAELN